MKQVQKATIGIAVCLVILLVSGVTVAESEVPVDVLFSRANNVYRQGDYLGAAELYEDMLTQGVVSASLYYNLANAYFRVGDYGRAILNYERANRLAPRDSDIMANMAYVRTVIDGELSMVDPAGRLGELYRAFTLNELAVVASMLYAVVLLMLAIGRLDRRRAPKLRIPIVASLILLAITLTLVGQSLYNQNYRKEAVVVVSSTDVRFEPLDNATVYFGLDCGRKVSIGRFQDEWAYVIAADGKSGWVLLADIEEIASKREPL